ncbi:MAG TPA: hypothetical protein PKA88_36200, partial [Polyangiaceae bacterium]|nr:hypothetical protein [Polyangiaceae bacterium]
MTVGTNTVMHDTIRLERQLAHPPSAVFAAYADVDQRVAWTAPSDDEIVVFEADDFRVGGLDQFRCGPRRAPDFVGTTRYDHIIDNELIDPKNLDGSEFGDCYRRYVETLDRYRFLTYGQIVSK